MTICFQKTHQPAFGTWPLKAQVLRGAIEAAVAAGDRAFGSAQMYRTEAEAGAALAGCDVARGERCVTTKVQPDNFTPERFLASVEQSLRDLRLDVVDSICIASVHRF